MPLVLATIILPTILGPSGLRNAIARAKRRWYRLLIAIGFLSIAVDATIRRHSIAWRSSALLIAAVSLIFFVRYLFYN